MDPVVIGQVTLLVALAELGDKSQLLCMSLATQWAPRSVFLGAVLAFALLNGLAVLVGATLGEFINPALAAGAAGALMLVLALSMLRCDDGDDDSPTAPPPTRVASPMLRTAALVGLAELGDKTQLEVAALATVWPSASVWLGATLALLITSGLGVWLGVLARDRLPTRRLQQVGAVLLAVVGTVLLVESVRALLY